jgi:chromosome segregation ATPase
LCCGSTAAAQNKKPNNAKQDEKRENEAVKEARQAVDAAEKAVREREQDVRGKLAELRSAQQARQSAAKDLQKVEDRLEAEHAESTGLAAAREKLKAAQTEFQQRARPLLERLKNQPEYQAAQQALDKAKAAIKPDPDRPDADRQAAVAAHAQAAEKVRQLEHASLDKDPDAKAWQAKVTAAEADVQSAKKKFERAVERDGDLKAARKAFEKAKQEEDAVEQAVAAVQRKLADAQGEVAKARQKLQQKVAQDLKDDNKPNKKKNK